MSESIHNRTRTRRWRTLLGNALLIVALLAFIAITVMGCATAPNTPDWMQWAFVSLLAFLGVVAGVGALLNEAWDRF